MSTTGSDHQPAGIPLILVPDRLKAVVHPHQIQAGERVLPCLTAITDGLASAGQREVVMTIVASPDTAGFPPGLAGYLQVLLTFAEEGRVVGEGGVSGYAAPGPFGYGPFVGAAFTRAQAVPGVPVPADALAAVLLTEGELAMAQVCSLRVLNRLGAIERWYPFPFWSDAARTESAYQPQDADATILARLPRGGMPDAEAVLTGAEAVFTVGRADAELLADELAAGRAAAALPGWSPAATGALVWTPGQGEPTATTADPELAEQHLTLSFIALVPGAAGVSDAREPGDGADPADGGDAADAGDPGDPGDQIQFLEDGFAAVLTPASAAPLIEVLRSGGEWTDTGSGPYRLRIVVR